MATINSNIEDIAQSLLDFLGISQAPIPVEDIAKRKGIKLLSFDLGSDVSGVLHIKNESASIGYNPNESKVRQRFTIAHELGHFILHNEKNKIFVDNENYYSLIKFRSSKLKLSDIDYQHEEEANKFAAALLMPVSLIQKEIKNYTGFDLSDGSMIAELAKKFEVSAQAMSFRIINLFNSDLL